MEVRTARGAGFHRETMEAQVSRPLMVTVSLRLIFLLCFFSALPRRCRFLAAEAAPTLIASLPGFDGPLPFRLETGYVFLGQVRDRGRAERRGAVLLLHRVGGRPTARPGHRLDHRRRPLQRPQRVAVRDRPVEINRRALQWYHTAAAVPSLRMDQSCQHPVRGLAGRRRYNVGEVSSSLQLKKFLTKWFTEHPDYLPNPFYVGGDSSGGKIVPFLAQKISEDIEAGVRPLINLKGYLVGNPATGENIDYGSRVPYLHGMGIISDQLYETIMEHCEGEDYSNPKNALCAQALYRCNQLYDENSHPHILHKKCVYTSSGPDNGDTERKILKEETGVLKHPPPRPPMDCQTYGNYLSYFWANNNITRKALGIKKGSKDEWVRCHERDLPYSLDIKSTIKYHRNMTLKGYRALVYSGDHDAIIPFLGTQSWVRSLNFPIVDEWRAWHLHGQSAGFTITYTNNLTFATVKNGGHTAPEFEPERCLAMFARWVSHESL